MKIFKLEGGKGATISSCSSRVPSRDSGFNLEELLLRDFLQMFTSHGYHVPGQRERALVEGTYRQSGRDFTSSHAVAC